MKKTPYDLILGYTPQAHQPTAKTNLPDIETWLLRIKEAQNAAQEAICKSQEELVKATKFKGYEEGQKVWLEGTNLKWPYDSTKLSPKQYRLFVVAAKISPVAYKLHLPEVWQIHNIFHASLLTPFTETEEHRTNFIEPPPDNIEGGEEWEIEEIIGKRTHGWGKKEQYLVQWKGYSPAHNQWVNKEDVHAKDLVTKYEAKQMYMESQPGRSIRTPRKLVDSARCPACSSELETVTHYLLECAGYAYERWTLKEEANKLSIRISLETLLGNPDLTISLANFIDSTHWFKLVSTSWMHGECTMRVFLLPCNAVRTC
jgi:Chromo (CHRromatin Organisation MOdifier) domain